MSNPNTLQPNVFSSTNQPTKPRTKRGRYLTPILRKLLEKKIDYIDPETNTKIIGKVKDAIVWRLLLNAAQGDNVAIREILERTDGKVAQKLEGVGGETRIVVIYPENYKPKDKLEDKSTEFPGRLPIK